MSFEFFPNEQDTSLRNAARQPSLNPDPGVWQGFLPGAGSYAMRSLAEVGRAVSMAGSVLPIAHDLVHGGTKEQDAYFAAHDETFQSAVDYWTPLPADVGVAGQVAGQLAGGIAQAIISPALLVATSQLSSAEDLVRQGVDPRTANIVGGIAGTGMAMGVRMPFLGETVSSRVASGVAGNVAQGAAVAGGSRAVLSASGYPVQAAQYDPLDVKARTLDALLGAAFGGLAHLQAAPKVSPREQAALLVANQAHHMETSTSPGRPVTDADATAHVQALRQAVDQLLKGDTVSVDDVTRSARFEPDATYSRSQEEVGAEILRLAREEAPPAPIDAPLKPAGDVAADADPIAARARLAAQNTPDLPIPTGRFAEDGSPVTLRAADVIAHTDAETAAAKELVPNIFRTAASCLLGAL